MLHKTNYGLNVSVEILRDSEKDIAEVHIHAPMYISKHWVMTHSYQSSAFSDSQILRDSDFISVMAKHYQ